MLYIFICTYICIIYVILYSRKIQPQLSVKLALNILFIFDPIVLFNLAFSANIKLFLVVDAQKLLAGLSTHTHVYVHTYVVKIFIAFPRLYQSDD